MKTNFELAVELIKQATYKELVADFIHNATEENPEIKIDSSIVDNFISAAEYGYVLVEWPESQDLMDEDWFDEEAVLSSTGSSAYFVPIKRLL